MRALGGGVRDPDRTDRSERADIERGGQQSPVLRFLHQVLPAWVSVLERSPP